MSVSFYIRCAFVCVVAVLAAAIADPLVEWASNAGWFGAGHFTDRSTVDVLPALAVALLAACARGGLQIAKLVTGRAAGWLRVSDTVLRRQSLVRALPLAFGLQLCVLYVMETAEQLVVRGHLLGPMVWLGGPAPIALLVHAVVCVCVALAALWSLRGFTRVAVRIIARILEPESRSAQPLATRSRSRRDGILSLQLICVLAHLRERAPPLLRT